MTLEQRLAALADDAFPPTPDLAAWAGKSVPQTDFPAQPRRQRQWTRSRWLPLALAALLVPATAAAVITLQPEHIRIKTVETLPPLPARTPRLGPTVKTVDEAGKRAGFKVQALPKKPQSIRVLNDLVTLAYPDVVITETPAREEPKILIKMVTPRTTVQRVAEGYFFSGAPHEVGYLAPDGRFVRLPPRLAGNTLAIERDGLLIRIEGEDLSLRRALHLSQLLNR